MWSVPVAIRSVLARSSFLLALQAPPHVSNDTRPRPVADWFCYVEAPIHSTRKREFHARATRNTDPRLLRIISAHVSRSTDLRLLLESYCDAELKFRSDNFLVTRIDGANVTIAAGKHFPMPRRLVRPPTAKKRCMKCFGSSTTLTFLSVRRPKGQGNRTQKECEALRFGQPSTTPKTWYCNITRCTIVECGKSTSRNSISTPRTLFAFNSIVRNRKTSMTSPRHVNSN